MKKLSIVFGVLFAILIFYVSATADETRILRQPDISKNKIVFVYGGDLWTAPIDGGRALRLTSHDGMETNPKFSPDGKYIAFSGEYDGNTDVYVIPSEGGKPVRLTYHPGGDYVVNWTPDGKSILFNSSRDSYSRFSRFFVVSKDGGMPEPLEIPMGYLASYSADGKFLAYTPLPNAFNTWKRYRGGLAPKIWIYNFADRSIKKIPHDKANDTNPIWLGDKIFFLSDRDRIMNLFSYDLKTEKVNQLSKNKNFDIKSASGNGELIVFESQGVLRLFDPLTGASKKIEIKVPAELLNIRPHFKKVADEIRSINISPNGKRALFEAHGEILTVPAEKGDVRNLTNSPGVMDRDPAWSPDGNYIAYFSDAGDEYALYIIDQMGEKKAEKITFKNPSFYYSPRWSPDSKKIVFTDKHLNLYYLDLDKNKPVLIDTDTYSHPQRSLDPVWSSDSKWIAYTKRLDNHLRAVFLYSLAEKKFHQITDGMSDALSPVFDLNGKYLYFLASTDAGLRSGWLDLSSYNTRVTRNVYLAVLRDDVPSPLFPESDEEKPAVDKKEEKKEDNQKKNGDETKDIRIDIKGIDQRILSLPIPAREYFNLQAAADSTILFLESIPNDQGAKLHRFTLKERKAEPFLEKVNDYVISANGKKLLYLSNKQYAITDVTGKPDPTKGKLNTAVMEVKVDPHAEWAQMYYEAWRINRDFFYDPNMHGIDWKKMRNKYAQFLPHVAHRSDLNFLIGEMIGELAVGHAYVGGGDYPEVERVPGGLLGADYEIVNDRYRIKKIYSGLNWNPDLKAPLTEPGVKVSEGDFILNVNGVDLKAPTNIYSLFEKTAGKQVTLKVNSSHIEEGSWQITVVPIANEGQLRNRAWVESNLRKVEQLSNGKVGYVYLPNTAGAGYQYFVRYFFSQLGKEGLVVDERFNGGGKAADYIIDMLDRPLLNYWATRDGKDISTPLASIFGPKAMIINEYAGSGGDAMPLYFKRRGIGPLVGKRSWGGLIGVYDYPRLMDGGFVTAPRIAIWSPDGEWEVENVGVYPDVEVEMIPAEVIQGRDPQLEKAVEVVLEELQKNPLPKKTRPKYPTDR